MTVNITSPSHTQVPGFPSAIGGLALVVPQRYVTASSVEALRSIAHQYVDRFDTAPVTLPYSPASSTLFNGLSVTTQPALRIDAYRAPDPQHPHARSFPVWVHRVRDIALRHNFGVLIIPATFIAQAPGLIVTDVDSTLIAQEVIEEIAAYAGTRDKVKAITDRAMNGELDFAESLRERVATLRGVPKQVLLDVIAHIEIHAGAQTLVNTVHQFGGHFGIVSGGFEEVVAPLARHLNIDHYVANRLGSAGGFLTGLIEGDIVTAQTKVEMLQRWAGKHQVPLERTVAVGDGANDIPMMNTAGLGIAFCAKPNVQRAVASQLSLPRLDALTCLF